MYEYKALIERIVDADTVDVRIDLGFSCWSHQRIRLIGINAAEKNTEYGKLAIEYVKNVLPIDSEIILQTEKGDKEKYGRYLGRILFPSSRQCLNDTLIAMGYAVEYWGKQPKEQFVPKAKPE